MTADAHRIKAASYARATHALRLADTARHRAEDTPDPRDRAKAARRYVDAYRALVDLDQHYRTGAN